MTSEKNNTYVFETSAAELERLIELASLCEEAVRTAFCRIGLKKRSKVVDFGCGPAGALLVLSDLVGPRGKVVGIDMNQVSLDKARDVMRSRGRNNFQLVCANVNNLESAILCPPGPFDAAYCRLFLMHQSDPLATLRRMASVVRPGGHIVMHELLFFPPPMGDPPIPEYGKAHQYIEQAVLGQGGLPKVAGELHTLALRAQLKAVSHRVFMIPDVVVAPRIIRLAAESVKGLKGALLKHGIDSEANIDSVIRALEHPPREIRSFYSAMQVEVIAQVSGASAGERL